LKKFEEKSRKSEKNYILSLKDFTFKNVISSHRSTANL